MFRYVALRKPRKCRIPGIAQFINQPNLRGIVAIGRKALDGPKELLRSRLLPLLFVVTGRTRAAQGISGIDGVTEGLEDSGDLILTEEVQRL